MKNLSFTLAAVLATSLLASCSLSPTVTYPVFPAEATAARNNSFDAGYVYENGYGVPRDYGKAIESYERAARLHGDARALNNLGVMAAQGRGTNLSASAASSYFRKAAAGGSAAAHYNIGLMFDAGVGYGRSMKAAVAEYRMAAEMGHAAAQVRLARILEAGEGGFSDAREATRLYEMAAERGDRFAQSKLGLLKKQNLTPAEASAILAVEHCEACSSPSEKAASSREIGGLQLLAGSGDPVAQYNLGVRHLQGDGSVLDPSEAARMFTLAARQGYGPAQRQLAQLHLRGQGVAKSKVLAHAWLNLAARNQDGEGSAARAEMESLEVSMTTSEIEEAQSVAASGQLKGR